MSNAGEAVGGCAVWEPPGDTIKKKEEGRNKGSAPAKAKAGGPRQRHGLAAFIRDGKAGWANTLASASNNSADRLRNQVNTSAHQRISARG